MTTGNGDRPSTGSLAPIDASGLAPGTVGLRQLLERSRGQIAAALPKHLTVDRVLRVAMTAIQTTPGLLDCTPLSVLGGVVLGAQLGLEIGGPLGHAYLVPFKPERGAQPIATFIPGYRGMVDLARRSGAVSTIEAHVVKKKDRFEYALGLVPKLVHVPYQGDAEPGPSVAVYAICRLRDGSIQFEVLARRDVEHVRKRSKAAGSQFSPWNTDPDEMWKKTAIRRLWKLLPVSVERAMEKAVTLHDRAETGGVNDASGVLLGEADLFGAPAGDSRSLEPAEPDQPAGDQQAPARRTTRRAAARDDAPTGPDASAKGSDAPQPQPEGRKAPPKTKRAEMIEWLDALRREDPEALEVSAQLPVGSAMQLDLARASDANLETLIGNAKAWLRDNPKPIETDGTAREPGDDRDQQGGARR